MTPLCASVGLEAVRSGGLASLKTEVEHTKRESNHGASESVGSGATRAPSSPLHLLRRDRHDAPAVSQTGAVGRPQTQYVEVGDADVGYQIHGDGPMDVLWCFGLGSNVDNHGDIAPVAEFRRGLTSFCRLIIFDRRGTGVSDAISGGSIPTWEQWAEDIGCVLDAAGTDRTAIIASLDAGPMA